MSSPSAATALLDNHATIEPVNEIRQSTDTTTTTMGSSHSDNTANILANGQDGISLKNKPSAIVKSSDGKFHRMILDPDIGTLEFTLLKYV